MSWIFQTQTSTYCQDLSKWGTMILQVYQILYYNKHSYVPKVLSWTWFHIIPKLLGNKTSICISDALNQLKIVTTFSIFDAN